MAGERAPIEGSERPPVAGAERVGEPDPDRLAEVTITLRGRGTPTGTVSREEFAEQYGADPADIQRVEDFAAAHRLEVVEASAPRRTVVVRGRLADLAAAFGTELGLYEQPDLGTFRGRTGPLTVPSDVHGAVESVLGLDDRPAAFPHFKPAKQAAPQSFTPPQLATLYGFPAGTGAGQTVAIIELGGGFKTADLTAYWKAIGISPAPKVEAVSVDGATNAPTGDPNGPDGEVMLDIEVVGGVAPAAHIAVYFAPNTTRGFMDAITTAVHDTTRKPSVVSISWGQAEDNWTAQARTAYDKAFQDAAALGVTICVAAGDDGSADGVDDGQAHVDFPSSSPFALACGGTKLVTSGTTISSETVWNEPQHGATGGGVSRFFALPGYQKSSKVPVQVNTKQAGRGVPDVAGVADPLTGYTVRVDGQTTVIGGTSAVAPLWAGLLARINGQLGHGAGAAQAKLYAHAKQRDITSGNNGAYKAAKGWDACTGLGSPNGAEVLAALS